MHGLLNIAEGLNDQEGFADLAKLFQKLFGNVPAGVYFRIKDVVNSQKADPAPSRQAPPVVDGQGKARPRTEKPLQTVKQGQNVRVPDPMRPTKEDQILLDEYRKAQNGHQPVNNVFAASLRA